MTNAELLSPMCMQPSTQLSAKTVEFRVSIRLGDFSEARALSRSAGDENQFRAATPCDAKQRRCRLGETETYLKSNQVDISVK